MTNAIPIKKATTMLVTINSFIPNPRINSKRVFTLLGIYNFVFIFLSSIISPYL